MSKTRLIAAPVLIGFISCVTPDAAHAGNMGFRLERSFNLVRNATTGRPLPSVYWLSQPLLNGLGDVGVSDANGSNACCVGVGACPATGDGRIESVDAVCEYWTAKSDISNAGVFQWSFYDRETCLKRSFTGVIALGGIRFTGVSVALDREIGYEIVVGTSRAGTATPVNDAVIVGAHDPSFAGRTIRPGTRCAASALHQDMLNLPYHSVYRTSDEILCGLEGTAWLDADVNGNPDTCPGGLFDGAHAIQVEWFRNGLTTSQAHGRTAFLLLGHLGFTGMEFDLVPGEAYRLTMLPTQTPRVWLPPHF